MRRNKTDILNTSVSMAVREAQQGIITTAEAIAYLTGLREALAIIGVQPDVIRRIDSARITLRGPEGAK